MTGRIGDTQLAVLDVEQDDYANVPMKNLFVGRVSTRVFDESNVGMIATHGDPRRNGDNTLLGLDFNYLNSRLGNGARLVSHGWVMGTDSDGMQGRDGAFGLDMDYPNEPLRIFAQARQFGEKFDPALGFVSRRGVRDYSTLWRYVWRPNTAFLRSVNVSTRWEYFTDLHNRIVTEDSDIATITFTSPAGTASRRNTGSIEMCSTRISKFSPASSSRPEIISTITSGSSRTRATRGPSAGMLVFATAAFTPGTGRDYEAGATCVQACHFSTSAGYELNDVHLDAGNFKVHIVTCRLNHGVHTEPDLEQPCSIRQYQRQLRFKLEGDGHGRRATTCFSS